MYLAEDRVRRPSYVNVVVLRFLYNALIDPMLGTGVEARRSIGSSLCQVGLRHYGSDQVRVDPSSNNLTI